jgi:hypothetical protein
VTTVSLGRFEDKNILFCFEHRFLGKKSFETGWGPGAHQLLRTVLFIQKNLTIRLLGANPTIASYNASVVNFYNAAGSLARFENKKIFYSTLKRDLTYYNAGVVAVN